MPSQSFRVLMSIDMAKIAAKDVLGGSDTHDIEGGH